MIERQLVQEMDKLWEKSAEEVAVARKQSKSKEKEAIILEGPSQTSAVGLAKWLGQSIEKINRQIDQTEEELGIKCVCHEGCKACCHQAIQVLPTEAKAISAVINQFTPEQKVALKQKILDWKMAIEASGLDTDQNKYYKKGVAADEIYEFMKAYFKLQLPCPLLSEEGSCSIYSVRPGGCWSYRVYSDPKECETNYSVAGGMKHDEWERYLLDHLFFKGKVDHEMKLLPYYIEDILNHRL